MPGFVTGSWQGILAPARTPPDVIAKLNNEVARVLKLNDVREVLTSQGTTPLATGTPFNWKDLTPIAMMALDQFVLWVNAEAPYKPAQEYITAVKGGADRQFKMGGTGSKQEDQIITVAIERLTGGKKFEK